MKTATMKQIRKWVDEAGWIIQLSGTLIRLIKFVEITRSSDPLISISSEWLYAPRFKKMCTALMDAEGYDWRAT